MSTTFSDRLDEDGTLHVERDPARTEHANELIAEELRIASGAKRYVLTGEASRGQEPGRKQGNFAGSAWDSRILLWMVGGALVVLGAMLLLDTRSWGVLPLAVGVLLVVATFVGRAFFKITGQVEKPDPDAVSRLQAEGELDPENEINVRVRAIAASTQDGDRDERAGDANAAKEQQTAFTPTAETSEGVDSPDHTGAPNAQR